MSCQVPTINDTGQGIWGHLCVHCTAELLSLAVYREERGSSVASFLQRLWKDEQGQDIAEYAVMLAVILVIVVGTIRLIGGNANNVFSSVGSAIQ
jgi:Flp pilus assembly pilin Flp